MNSMKKNYIYNTLYQVLILAVPIITTPYLTRIIGADGIGVYSYNYSVTNYFTLFVLLGLENYGNREIAKHKSTRDELSYTFSSIYLLQVFMGILVFLTYVLYMSFFSQNPRLTLIFGINILAACFDINWCLYGLELFKNIALRNTAIKAITTLSIFTFVKDGNDVIIYCLIMLISNLVSQLCAWPMVLRRLQLVKPKFRDIFKHFMPNMWLFLTVLSVGIYKSTDKVMLGIVDPEKTMVGFYELAERIIAIPNMLVVSLGTVMMPRITSMVSNKEENYSKLLMPSLFFSLFLSSSMCFGIMGVSREFVPLFYGEGYDTCIALYLILLPCSLFMSFANVIRTQYILPNTMDKVLVKAGIYGTVMNIGFNLLLIPRFGAQGAAFATLLAEAFGCIYQSLNVRKHLPLKTYVRNVAPLAVIGFLMFAVIYSIDFSWLTSSMLIAMVLKIVIGFVIYMTGLIGYLLLIRRSSNNEYQEIKDLMNRYIPRKMNGTGNA